MFFELLLTVGCIIFIAGFFKSIYIIPPRHFAVVEYLGTFSHVLRPGVNIVIWPVYYLRYIHWKWERTYVRGYMASRENCQMDIKPTKCKTKDQLEVKVDGTLFYNINNPEKAIYETEDVLNLFYQTANQAIRNTCNSFSYKELNGQDNIIGSHVKNYINDELEQKYGIVCIKFLVQDVTANAEVDKKSTELFISSTSREAQLEATKLEAEKIRILREARGYTPEQEIAFERAKNVKFIILESKIASLKDLNDL